MIKKFFFSFFLTTILFAQTNSLLEVKKLYEDYEYEKVIQTSNVLLNDEQFPDSLKIDLYFMRAVSFFAIGNENLSKTNFENLLKLNKNYILDTSKLSPKIINFFDEVKKEYLKKEEEKIYSPENLEKLKQLAQEREILRLVLLGVAISPVGGGPITVIRQVLSTTNLLIRGVGRSSALKTTL